MKELFGAPMSAIAAVLGALFFFSIIALAYIAVRHGVLVRMAARNIPRRPAQSLLIVLGMMLATAIIASAFTTGDSISRSIEHTVAKDLRYVDQFVRVDKDSAVWKDRAVPGSFPESIAGDLARVISNDPDVDGAMPTLVQGIAVVNSRARQFEVNSLLTGFDPTRTGGFGELRDQDGKVADLGALGPGETYLDTEGARKLDARTGDVLAVPLGPNNIRQVVVKGILDGYYFKRADTKVVLMMPLAGAQELTGKQGLVSRILVSNAGDIDGGERLTPAIQQRLKDLPGLRDAGLELFGVKSDLVEQANRIASLFVTIFTTFGLFSIGVGILLIFLIFSMLAAERKSEMGISRAIGMQRSHLVQMFFAEGSFYGIASAIVGALIGVGVGYLLVIGVASAITQRSAAEDFSLTPSVTLRSVLVSFFAGSVVTFITVAFAARNVSRLNIVRAIRDIPEPRRQRASRPTLIWGIVVVLLGFVVMTGGISGAQFSAFGLGASLIPIGLAMVLRWRGLSERRTMSLLGLFLLVFWLLPGSVWDRLRVDWSQDLTVFFVSGSLVVSGAVLLVMNNTSVVLGAVTRLTMRARWLVPIAKSAVSYPLRAGFRTGLSVAMFAVVIFSIVVMMVITTGFNRMFDDQQRLAGGYQIIAAGTTADLNPVDHLAAEVEGKPDLSFVTRVNGEPSVGTLRTLRTAGARMAASADGKLQDALVTGVDDDFIASNRYRIKLATEEFRADDGFDSAAVWKALKEHPGYAIASASLFPSRDNFSFEPGPDFKLSAEGLYLQNATLDPLAVLVRDRDSGKELQVTVVAVLDPFGLFLPPGIFVSTGTLADALGRPIKANHYFFHVSPGTQDAAGKIEAAFFQNGLDTVDIQQTLKDQQSSQTSVNTLLIGFMALGLVVGIAALGVISARAVVERRHHIGVMRAIGFSRGMVQATFLMESSFIAMMGIALGLVLGLITSVNVIASISKNEPNIHLVVPWLRIILIGLGAYVFSLLTTFLPSRQASHVAHADALRYE